MSPAPVEPPRRLAGPASGNYARCATLLSFIAVPICAEASSSFFFASPQACASSGRFRSQQCENAFANALAALRERAPRFPDRWNCRARYHLCEREGDGDQSYRPTLIGVEIWFRGRQAAVAPVLAVETPPHTFEPLPISHAVRARPRRILGFAPILPAGRFRTGRASLEARDPEPSPIAEEDLPAPTGNDESAPRTHESADARRVRLRGAPLVE